VRRIRIVSLLLGLACASADDTVHGRAEVVQWDSSARVIQLCETGLRYQLGIFTSNAEGGGARDVEQWLADQPGPLLVEVVGFPAELPSGWPLAPEVSGVLSVGSIWPLAHKTCS